MSRALLAAWAATLVLLGAGVTLRVQEQLQQHRHPVNVEAAR